MALEQGSRDPVTLESKDQPFWVAVSDPERQPGESCTCAPETTRKGASTSPPQKGPKSSIGNTHTDASAYSHTDVSEVHDISDASKL